MTNKEIEQLKEADAQVGGGRYAVQRHTNFKKNGKKADDRTQMWLDTLTDEQLKSLKRVPRWNESTPKGYQYLIKLFNLEDKWLEKYAQTSFFLRGYDEGLTDKMKRELAEDIQSFRGDCSSAFAKLIKERVERKHKRKMSREEMDDICKELYDDGFSWAKSFEKRIEETRPDFEKGVYDVEQQQINLQEEMVKSIVDRQPSLQEMKDAAIKSEFHKLPHDFHTMRIGEGVGLTEHNVNNLKAHVVSYLQSWVLFYTHTKKDEDGSLWLDDINMDVRLKGLGDKDVFNLSNDEIHMMINQKLLDLSLSFGMWKNRERNTVLRIPKELEKSHSNWKIDRDILKHDLKKTFFHLTDSIAIDFADKYDFVLNLNHNKEDDGYQVTFSYLKKITSQSLKEIWMMTDNGQTGSMNLSNDPNDKRFVLSFDLFSKVKKEDRNEFMKQCLNYLDEQLRGMLFIYDTKENDTDGGGVHSFDGKYIKDIIENGGNIPDIDDPDIKGFYEKVLDKLCICLEWLKFSHKREFVTNNKTFTKNMKKAAKGLPKKPEKLSHKDLTREKEILLPRKEYLSYRRQKGSGTHASPVGHRRGGHFRTYTHEKYAESGLQGKTVKIESCDVMGGPEKNQTTVYKPTPKSEMVKDFVSQMEKNKNG